MYNHAILVAYTTNPGPFVSCVTLYHSNDSLYINLFNTAVYNEDIFNG